MSLPESRRFSLAEVLSPASMQLQLSGKDRSAVLAELVNCVPELTHRAEARQTLLQAIEEREQLCSTGVGDGVALPHARNALVGLVEKPMIVFGRHVRGVDFRAVDGKPAKLFFLLVAPTVTQHLQILSRLSRLLRNASLRRTLRKAESAEQIMAALQVAEARLRP